MTEKIDDKKENVKIKDNIKVFDIKTIFNIKTYDATLSLSIKPYKDYPSMLISYGEIIEIPRNERVDHQVEGHIQINSTAKSPEELYEILHLFKTYLEGAILNVNENIKKLEREMEKEKLYDKILNYFNHRTEEIPFEKLKEEFKVEDTLLMDVLEELKENGEIYEPRAGEYKIL